MTDRERLDQMAKEAQEKVEKQVAEEKRKQAEHIAAKERTIAEEKQKTEELLKLCETTFSGFKLVPTGHEVHVGTTSVSKMFHVQNDGVEYVHLSIDHFGDATNNFQGWIPFLLCRYKGGMYEYLIGPDSKKTPTTLDNFKETLMRLVAGFGESNVKALFDAFKRTSR